MGEKQRDGPAAASGRDGGARVVRQRTKEQRENTVGMLPSHVCSRQKQLCCVGRVVWYDTLPLVLSSWPRPERCSKCLEADRMRYSRWAFVAACRFVRSWRGSIVD
jgi:hypothetical protein